MCPLRGLVFHEHSILLLMLLKSGLMQCSSMQCNHYLLRVTLTRVYSLGFTYRYMCVKCDICSIFHPTLPVFLVLWLARSLCLEIPLCLKYVLLMDLDSLPGTLPGLACAQRLGSQTSSSRLSGMEWPGESHSSNKVTEWHNQDGIFPSAQEVWVFLCQLPEWLFVGSSEKIIHECKSWGFLEQ